MVVKASQAFSAGLNALGTEKRILFISVNMYMELTSTVCSLKLQSRQHSSNALLMHILKKQTKKISLLLFSMNSLV